MTIQQKLISLLSISQIIIIVSLLMVFRVLIVDVKNQTLYINNAFDAYLLIQGMKTLEIRMDRHCSNTEKVAQFLDKHPAIEKVNYAGLVSHPDHAIAKKQMKQHAPLISFELKGGLDAGKKFIDALEICTRAVSLGTVDTLVSHPATMTHYGIPKEERIKYGITDGLIRMSVGIENFEDIAADLTQALAKV